MFDLRPLYRCSLFFAEKRTNPWRSFAIGAREFGETERNTVEEATGETAEAGHTAAEITRKGPAAGHAAAAEF